MDNIYKKKYYKYKEKYTQLKKRPALGSVFLRYALPKDHAEVYVEYGRNDRGATPINVFYDSVATGYVGGIRKLFLLPNSRVGHGCNFCTYGFFCFKRLTISNF